MSESTCAVETVKNLSADLAAGKVLSPANPSRDAIPALLTSRGVRWIPFDQWNRIDAIEIERGTAAGRPRVKMVTRNEITEALGG